MDAQRGNPEGDWRTWLDSLSGAIPLDRALHRIAVEEGSEAPFRVVGDGLDSLADAIPAAPDPLDHLANLVRHLFVTLDFRGDLEGYDEPENSRIDRVLERRRGLPILLSAVVLEVGRRIDVPLVGVGYPGHFLVATAGEPRVFLDPFDRGRIRPRSELVERLHVQFGDLDDERVEQALAPASPRDLLLRVSTNLMRSWDRRGLSHAALRNAERRVALRPEVPELRRDRGLLRAAIGRAEEAAFDLGTYLAERPEAEDASQIRWRLSVAAHASLTPPR